MPDLDIARISIAFLVLLFSLTVHESAHAWTADRLGDSTARMLGRVSLNPMVHADLFGTIVFPLLAMVSGVPLIGWAKPVPVLISRLRHPRRDAMLVAAAGPASNLVLAVFASLSLSVLGIFSNGLGESVLAPLAVLFAYALSLNILLAVFNLLPIPPLDGGNVLGGLLPRGLGARYDAFIRPYGFLVLYALMFTSGFDYLVGGPARFLASLLAPIS